MEQTTEKQRWGIHRLLFVLIVVGNIIGAMLIKPILPHIQLPAEPISGKLFTFLNQDFHLTNTLLATGIAYIFILLVAFFIRRQLKQGKMVLDGFSGVFAALLEMLYSLTETTAGKYAKRIFPWFATIFLIVLVANWMELFPGVDSIGILHHDDHGYPIQEGEFLGIRFATLVESDGAHGAAGEHEAELYGLYPFIRAAATDLNFTVGLALISVSVTQIFGLIVLGSRYLVKYVNVSGLWKSFKKPGFGNPLDFILALVNFAVGLLEVVSETSKIISFAFRLFGVIFAGQVLLFVIGTLVPYFVQAPFYLLELFFGALQAFVFGMLTMVFMVGATHAHGDHAEEHH
ncbi:MAG: F0F1 ATP synthase subunit A [Anaerolineales bacterium]|nr:F0F1 ATP synthase subunit A [Anaerolineales bacterium]